MKNYTYVYFSCLYFAHFTLLQFRINHIILQSWSLYEYLSELKVVGSHKALQLLMGSV